jgi:hypothetical protein
LVRLKVDLIMTYGTAPVVAAKQVTSIIPVVFAVAGDPARNGLVASLARPGNNVTGLSIQSTDSAAKKIELLREVLPGLRRLAIMANVDAPVAVLEMGEVQAAAGTLGLEAVALEIRRAEDIAPAFAALKAPGSAMADALYVVIDALVVANRTRIITLALGARLPTIFNNRVFVQAGGLMSYGANFSDLFRRHDASGFTKVLWMIFVIIVPYLGVFIYLLVNHDGMTQRAVSDQQAAQQQIDDHIRSVAPASSTEEIAKAKQLLDSGAINQAEYESLKAKALA